MKDSELNPALDYYFFKEIGSTNDYLLEHSFQKNTLILTEQQTRGRGRRGQPWQTANQSLLFSTGFLCPKEKDITLWPITCAISLCRSIQSIVQEPIQIKWPNDLLIFQENQYAKFCGILIESQRSNQNKVITGIGINLTKPSITSDYPVGFLKTELSKKEILHRLVNQLYFDWLLFLENPTLNPKTYEPFDYLKDKRIKATDSNQTKEIQGIARGINNNGSLNIEDNGMILPYLDIQQIRLLEF